MNFEPGEIVICIESGSDAPNPWHRANPLTLGAEYTVLRVVPCIHANGTRLDDMIAVDRSGRLWTVTMFRRRERPTDIGFAHEILRKATRKARAPLVTAPCETVSHREGGSSAQTVVSSHPWEAS